MNIADARDAYLNWNQKACQSLIENFPVKQQQALKLIPLLFQINHRSLPGYNGPDTPAGIYGYRIDKMVINAAKQVSPQFSYEQDNVLSRSIIQSIFIQHNIFNKELLLWVIYSKDITTRQLNELQDKLERVSRWLQVQGLSVDAYLSTEKDLIKKIKRHKKTDISLAYLLNSFYAESILMAGKEPVWWFVPKSEERNYQQYIDHALDVKLIAENSYVDFGCEYELKKEACINQLMVYIKLASENTEQSYIELLIFYYAIRSYPEINMPANYIKQQLHKGVRYYSSLLLYPVILDELKQVISDHTTDGKNQQISRLWSYLANNGNSVLSSIFSDLSGTESFSYHDDVFEKFKLYKLLQKQIKNTAEKIFAICDYGNEAVNKKINNMLALLSEKNNRIQVYVRGKKSHDAFDKIMLRKEHNAQWTFVLNGEEGEEKILPGFESLLALLAWLWLNRLVTPITQVSIDCSDHNVLQVEAYQILNTLTQRLDQDCALNISPRAYETEAKPILILVFVNARNNSCEQLLLNSWGDVYCSAFTGNQGFVECICEWTQYLSTSTRIKQPGFYAFGYSAGDANYMAQRMEQVFQDVFVYFYGSKTEPDKLIINMNDQYYDVYKKDHHLHSRLIGQRSDAWRFLESENKEFISYGLERYTLSDSPLREIFKKNKEHVVQVFFRLAGRNVETWIVDEKGSVWSNSQLCLDKDAYISQWLFFFKHIFSRLKKIKYQQTDCPTVEIQQVMINQQGQWEFFPVSTDDLVQGAVFYNIKLLIESYNHQDKMSLVCDDHNFNYHENEQDALSRCVQHIRLSSQGHQMKPIYLTDMDLPLSLFKVEGRDDIQVLHYLKYKRHFEKKLNQLVNHHP